VVVKVVTPTRLLAEAAEVLGPVRDELVVIGAAALEVALADSPSVAITPTRDVDVVVSVERAVDVVSHLESAGLRPSDVPYERGFTWVRGDVKVQLVRTFHPFLKPPADRFPENPAVGMAAKNVHQVSVAFADDPGRSTPAVRQLGLPARPQAGRLRSRATGRHAPVERDYHDAYLLISTTPHVVVAELNMAEPEVRRRARDAITKLAVGGEATAAAARQMVRLRTAESQRAAEAAVRRAAVLIQQRLIGDLRNA
jgi:hypothetical protein